MAVELTKEQEEFMKSLEEDFKDRYTEKDEDYKAYLDTPVYGPPIVDNVFLNSFRDNYNRYDRNHYERNESYERNNHYDRNDSYERNHYYDRNNHHYRSDHYNRNYRNEGNDGSASYDQNRKRKN